MDEVERILRLLSEGKITKEEAERLLAALEGPAAGASVGRLAIDADRAEIHVRPAPGDQVTARGFGAGELKLDRKGQEAWLRWRSRAPVLGRGRIEVELPAGWGVVLELGQGRLEAEALPFLKGSAGQARVRVGRLAALDFDLGQGRFEAGLALRQGRHRLTIGMGRAKIRPLPGADFVIEGEVGLGLAERRRFGRGAAVLEVRIGVGRLEVADAG